MRYKKLFVGVVTSTVALALGGGIAFAVWSATGAGSGAGAAATALTLTVNPVTPSGANASLYPGGPAGPVFVTITNPNPYVVSVTGVAYGAPTSTLTGSCASANISLTAAAPTAVSITVPAKGSVVNQPINGVLLLAHGAPNGCQGVAFDIPINITGTQK